LIPVSVNLNPHFQLLNLVNYLYKSTPRKMAAVVPIPPIPEDQPGALLHVLEHIIGLDTPAKRDRVTINAGVTSAEDLLYVELESLIDCLTATTSILAKTRLKTVKRWVEDEFDIEGNIDIRKFTEDICKERQRIIARSVKTTAQQVDKSTVSKEKLSTFNGKRENWLKAKRELTAYLNQIKNEMGVPIYYVVRDPDQEEKYREDNGEIGKKIYEAPFRGRVYETDAFQVLQILRQWTSGGTAETFVDNNNDVQDAWAQLVRNYEGHDAKNANIQKARDTINSAHWVRNTQNFSFDDYCNRHVKANNELDRYNSNVDGESQVNAFLKGIRTDPRQNPHLLPIKAIILNGENTRGNLRNAIIAFKDTMRQIIGTTNDRDTRHIGAFNRDGGRGRGRNHRAPNHAGRGRGHGRGGRYGGGNHPQGRGRGRTNNQEASLFIPNSVLEAVGPRYQAMLFRGRDLMEQESGNNRDNTTPSRNASATGQSDIVSEVTNYSVTDNKNNDNGGASSQFGATGRKKQRTINAITTSNRRIGKAIKVGVPSDYIRHARAEIDTRADTICAGSTFLLHESTGKVVDVTGFHEALEPIKNIQIGTCITAIDLTNETIIASFPQ
jgi:hypothetical protein